MPRPVQVRCTTEEKHTQATAAAENFDAWLAEALRLERLAISNLLERRHGSLLQELKRQADRCNDSGIVSDERTSIQLASDHFLDIVVPREKAPEIPSTHHDADGGHVCDGVVPRELTLQTRTSNHAIDAFQSPQPEPGSERERLSAHSDFRNHVSRRSRGSVVVAEIIDELELDDESAKKEAKGGEHRFVPAFEAAVGVVILISTFIMAAERQYASFDLAHKVLQLPNTRSSWDTWPWAKDFFQSCEWIIGSIFACEVVVKVCVLRLRYFKSPWHLFDFVIVFFWVISRLSSNFIINPALLRVARLVRLARLLRVVRVITFLDPLHILVKSVASSVAVLFWSLLLLVLLIIIVSLMTSESLVTWMENAGTPLKERVQVFEQWGSFSRASTTMFEITLGNWGPPCRLLQNLVNEWWAVFVVSYKCVIGFAVVQVITSVFIQQTFKVVARDEDVMIKDRAANAEAIVKNLDRLFTTLDETQDGVLTREEFDECVTDRKVQSWLGALDIDVIDVGNLFHVLDCDGDGTISRKEFIDGIRHVKGTAKNLDMLHLLKATQRIEQGIARSLSALQAMTALEESELRPHPRK